MFKMTINNPDNKNGTGKCVRTAATIKLGRSHTYFVPRGDNEAELSANFSCVLFPFAKSSVYVQKRLYICCDSIDDEHKQETRNRRIAARRKYLWTIFLIGHYETSLSGYKYAREAMRTLHLACVRPIANRKLLSFRVVEEKRELSVEANLRTDQYSIIHVTSEVFGGQSVAIPW